MGVSVSAVTGMFRFLDHRLWLAASGTGLAGVIVPKLVPNAARERLEWVQASRAGRPCRLDIVVEATAGRCDLLARTRRGSTLSIVIPP